MNKELRGLIDIVKDYPAPGTWYLGLMLIDPAYRQQHLGTELTTTVANAGAGSGAPDESVWGFNRRTRAGISSGASRDFVK